MTSEDSKQEETQDSLSLSLTKSPSPAHIVLETDQKVPHVSEILDPSPKAYDIIDFTTFKYHMNELLPYANEEALQNLFDEHDPHDTGKINLFEILSEYFQSKSNETYHKITYSDIDGNNSTVELKGDHSIEIIKDMQTKNKNYQECLEKLELQTEELDHYKLDLETRISEIKILQLENTEIKKINNQLKSDNHLLIDQMDELKLEIEHLIKEKEHLVEVKHNVHHHNNNNNNYNQKRSNKYDIAYPNYHHGSLAHDLHHEHHDIYIHEYENEIEDNDIIDNNGTGIEDPEKKEMNEKLKLINEVKKYKSIIENKHQVEKQLLDKIEDLIHANTKLKNENHELQDEIDNHIHQNNEHKKQIIKLDEHIEILNEHNDKLLTQNNIKIPMPQKISKDNHRIDSFQHKYSRSNTLTKVDEYDLTLDTDLILSDDEHEHYHDHEYDPIILKRLSNHTIKHGLESKRSIMSIDNQWSHEREELMVEVNLLKKELESYRNSRCYIGAKIHEWFQNRKKRWYQSENETNNNNMGKYFETIYSFV